jgi:hypothetical protein
MLAHKFFSVVYSLRNGRVVTSSVFILVLVEGILGWGIFINIEFQLADDNRSQRH